MDPTRSSTAMQAAVLPHQTCTVKDKLNDNSSEYGYMIPKLIAGTFGDTAGHIAGHLQDGFVRVAATAFTARDAILDLKKWTLLSSKDKSDAYILQNLSVSVTDFTRSLLPFANKETGHFTKHSIQGSCNMLGVKLTKEGAEAIEKALKEKNCESIEGALAQLQHKPSSIYYTKGPKLGEVDEEALKTTYPTLFKTETVTRDVLHQIVINSAEELVKTQTQDPIRFFHYIVLLTLADTNGDEKGNIPVATVISTLKNSDVFRKIADAHVNKA